MKTSLVLCLSVLLLSSCNQRKQVTSLDSPMIEEINRRATTETCEITLYGEPIHPRKITALQIGKDSIRWRYQETLLSTAIAVKDVTSVRFVDHGKGAMDGLLYGGLGSALVGALMGLASGDDKSGFINFSAGEKAGILGLVCGLVGGVVGVIGGAITGSTVDYIMPKR